MRLALHLDVRLVQRGRRALQSLQIALMRGVGLRRHLQLLLAGDLLELGVRCAVIGDHSLGEVLDLLILRIVLRDLARIDFENPADRSLVDERLRVVGREGRKGKHQRCGRQWDKRYPRAHGARLLCSWWHRTAVPALCSARPSFPTDLVSLA